MFKDLNLIIYTKNVITHLKDIYIYINIQPLIHDSGCY